MGGLDGFGDKVDLGLMGLDRATVFDWVKLDLRVGDLGFHTFV